MKKYFTPLQLAVLLLLGSALLNCKKDNNNPAKSKTQLLTQKTWKQVKMEQKSSPSDPWTDVTAGVAACDLDNIITFNNSAMFTETEGATRCNPADPDLVTVGSWTFQNNETVLRLTVTGSGTVDAQIETLDEGTLKYNISNPSVPVYLRVTMGH